MRFYPIQARAGKLCRQFQKELENASLALDVEQTTLVTGGERKTRVYGKQKNATNESGVLCLSQTLVFLSTTIT